MSRRDREIVSLLRALQRDLQKGFLARDYEGGEVLKQIAGVFDSVEKSLCDKR